MHCLHLNAWFGIQSPAMKHGYGLLVRTGLTQNRNTQLQATRCPKQLENARALSKIHLFIYKIGGIAMVEYIRFNGIRGV